MRVTKYPQSCMLLEKDAGRLLIDPGVPAMDAYSFDEFGEVQGVLYTHRHADHFDERHLDHFIEREVALYGNADVCALIGDAAIPVTDGEAFELAGMHIEPRELPHCPMVDGSEGPQNTGFVIDRQFLHPGDGISLSGLQVDYLAVPIAGPSVSFRDAYRFAMEADATTVIPIHYDLFIADPALFAKNCDIARVLVLAPGESAEL